MPFFLPVRPHKFSHWVKVLLLLSSLAPLKLTAQTLPLPPNLIDFKSPEGENLLVESSYRQDFFPLSSQFVTQDSLAYCGVASMVMVLNALGIWPETAANLGNYRYLTQGNFFQNPKTETVVSQSIVSRRGMTVEQLGQLLAAYSVSVKVYHGSDVTLEEFRQLLQENLQDPNNFVLVNYLGRSINQERGGHISPVAAYHQPSDRFLILDVARYRYPPVWVKAKDLWQAIRTVDAASGKTRGFVLVSK